jgi:hypothetical protein
MVARAVGFKKKDKTVEVWGEKVQVCLEELQYSEVTLFLSLFDVNIFEFVIREFLINA